MYRYTRLILEQQEKHRHCRRPTKCNEVGRAPAERTKRSSRSTGTRRRAAGIEIASAERLMIYFNMSTRMHDICSPAPTRSLASLKSSRPVYSKPLRWRRWSRDDRGMWRQVCSELLSCFCHDETQQEQHRELCLLICRVQKTGLWNQKGTYSTHKSKPELC
jgi:hypothetical protein